MILKAIKFTVLTGAVLAGTGFLLFGTNLGSYLGTMAGSVHEGIEGAIPVEFEIKRAENLILQIDPQIETCKRDVARAEVELEELQASVVELEQSVGHEEKRLKTGARLLGGDGDANYTLASDTMTRRRVERDLQRTLDSFRNNQKILEAKRSLIARQAEAVSVAKQRLSAVRSEKEVLADQVRSLRTQQHWIETMGASQKRFDLDDSALSQAKEALLKVQKRLDVAQKMLENDMVCHDEDPLASTEPGRDVLREIRDHFATGEAVVRAEATVVVEPHVVTVR
ncbi:MAG: hypothetical protein ABL997_03530 [Planctomycetota bacterium]